VVIWSVNRLLLIWLLAVVLTLGAAVGPAEGSKTHHYDFFVSR
jgi:hypothetical protein